MTKEQKMMVVMKYSDQILEVIYSQEEFTTSDLQARAEGIVLSILGEVEREK